MKIKELEIYSPDLEGQIKFYSEVLGLDIIKRDDTAVSFQIGNSILKLSYRKAFTPYHYAINIPPNQEQEALNWLKERVDILKYENKEIQYFDFWDAYAIYFYDHDGNIGELIARRNLENDSNEPFSSTSLLEISEMGIPTSDISREYKILKDTTDIPIFSGNLERFCAIGDDHGLFIVINKNLKTEWFPTDVKPVSADFKIKFIQKNKSYYFEYKNEVLKVLG